MSSPDELTRNLRSPTPEPYSAARDENTLDAAPIAVGSGELAPGTMIGEYQISDRVGHGAMGVVYGAIHPVIGKRAAVKVMRSFLSHSPEAIERFVQEARAVGRIGHPNIVDAFAFGVLPDGRCYFIMEWLKGCPLSLLVKQGPMALLDSLDVLDQVSRALEAAHAQGIIHRDLKPDNVFLQEVPDSRPLVKLLDFSIAKLADDEGARRHLTRTGVMVGTPAYVSPEQVRGAKVDSRTDVYALGVMTFEMVTGQLPFTPENRMALLFMHLNDPPPAPSTIRHGVPPALDQLIGRMLAKQPDARPTPREIRQVVAEVRDLLLAPAQPSMAMVPHPTPAPAPAPVPVVMVPAAGPASPATPASVPQLAMGAPGPMAVPQPILLGQPMAMPHPMPMPTPTPTPLPMSALPHHAITPVPVPTREAAPPRAPDRRLLAAGAVAIAAVVAASLTVVFVGGEHRSATTVSEPEAPPPPQAQAELEPVAAPPPAPEPTPAPAPAPAATAAPVPAAAPAAVPQAVPEKLPPMPPLPTPTGLSITVDADEAIIVVDGRIVGDSLKRLNLVLDEPGRHEVEITAPGRLPFRKTVTVDAGTTLPIRAELAPEGGRDSSFTRRPKRIESSRPVRRSAPAEEGPGARVTRDRPTRRSPPSSDEEDDDGTINPYPVRKR